jgi:stage V sporulation protein B
MRCSGTAQPVTAAPRAAPKRASPRPRKPEPRAVPAPPPNRASPPAALDVAQFVPLEPKSRHACRTRPTTTPTTLPTTPTATPAAVPVAPATRHLTLRAARCDKPLVSDPVFPAAKSPSAGAPPDPGATPAAAEPAGAPPAPRATPAAAEPAGAPRAAAGSPDPAGSPPATGAAPAAPAAAPANAPADAPANAPADAAPAAPSSGTDARAAGRGGLAVAAAKVWFIIAGLIQQTILPRLIGLDGYGAFSVVLAVANVPNNVITASSIQGVSRAVAAAGPAGEDAAQRRTLLIHGALAPCLAAAFFAAAPLVADFEHAPHITTPLRIFALVVLVYSLYTPLVGAINGRRRFFAQAGLDVTFATLRTIGLLCFAWYFGKRGAGVMGSAIGVALAAACILPFAFFVGGTGRPLAATAAPIAAIVTTRRHLGVLGHVAVGQLFLNVLMQSDIWLLRRFAHEAAAASGLAGDALRMQTDKLVGAYRAAQLFAFLPYQLLLSITFILFPMLARAHAEQNRDAVARYTRTGFRLAFVLAGLMVACTSGLGDHLLRLAFPREAADKGADALRLLALGQGAFTIFGMQNTVLVSLGRERAAAVLTASASALVVLLCWLLVPSPVFGTALLLRTATATSLALVCAASVGAVVVWRTANAFAAALTVARTLLAMAVAIAVGWRLPWMGRGIVPLEAVLVAGIYLAIAILTGEVGRADWALVQGTLGRKRAAR